MKTFTKLLFSMTVLLGLAVNSFGQATASADATASATIVAPLTITKDVDMNFGNIAVGASAGGTVTLPPSSGTPIRSLTGSITLPVVTGTVVAAKFIITGEGTSVYDITLPADGVVSLTGPGTAMPVDDFTSTPSTQGQLTAGTQDLYVGATLTVAASQAAGLYTGTFSVSVNYN
jgi:hypothetical protein